MNVVFLDIDGVVNTLIWENRKPQYHYPFSGSVNHFQACQWVSDFCKKYNYSIVISSSWRGYGLETCVKCLRAGGIWEEIPIIGMTPRIRDVVRGEEIKAWLSENKVDQFLIFDDDSDMGALMEHLIKCHPYVGFTLVEYQKAEAKHLTLQNDAKFENIV